jgi:hypothetical protein
MAPGTGDGNIQNLTPDPKVFWFPNADNKGRLFVAETQYDANRNPLPSEFSIYEEDLTQVWPAPTPQTPNPKATWDGLVNVYSISRDGHAGFIYGIDYDRALIFRINNGSGDDYAFDGTMFKYDDYIPANQKYGVDVYFDGKNVYGLFIRGENVFGGNYTNSAIIKLPPNLDSTGLLKNETDLSENAIAIKVDKSGSGVDDLYIASIGGAQHQNDTWNGIASKIQAVAKDGLVVTDLVRSAADSTEGLDYDRTDFHDFDILPNGMVFILKGKYVDSYGTFEAYVVCTTISDLKIGTGGLLSTLTNPSPVHYANDPDNSFGYFWALAGFNVSGQPTTGYAWVVLGDLDDFDVLYVFSYDGTAVAPEASIVIADLAPPSPGTFSFNALALINDLVQLRGAQHPHLASNSAEANQAKVSHAATVNAVKTAAKAAAKATARAAKVSREEENN